MSNKAGLIVPVVLILAGVYVLFITLGSNGEQVALFAGQVVPRGLAMAMGLIGLGGGAVVMFTALGKKRAAELR